MDKEKLITKIIFDNEDLSKISFPVKEEVISNFEIAWDIRDNFDSVIKNIKRNLIHKIVERIKSSEEFKNYEFKDEDNGFLQGKKFYPFLIFQKNWIINGNSEPLLSYAIEAQRDNYDEIILGIRKANTEKPFKGKLGDNIEKIPEKWKIILLEIKNKLTSQSNEWKDSDWWLIYKYFDSISEKEFYYKLLKKGYDKIADDYLNEIIFLKDQTEEFMNKFYEVFKNR